MRMRSYPMTAAVAAKTWLRHHRWAVRVSPWSYNEKGIALAILQSIYGVLIQLRMAYLVVINPDVVATIKRLPQSTMESMCPTPGTLSPGAAFQMPLGPSRVTVPL
jgi:hypothetical protein